MKKLIPSIFIFVSLTCYAQEKQSGPTKEQIAEAQKELQKMQNSDTELIMVEPAVVDGFIEAIRVNDMDSLYNMTDNDVKKVQSREDMFAIFGLYRKYYGQLKSYDQSSFGIKSNKMFGQMANVTYDVKYVKYEGKAQAVFKVYDERTVKMYSFQLSLQDYAIVDTFAVIAKPVLDAISAKDKKAIYNLTSERFKEYTSIADFESNINKILDTDLSDLMMYRNQIGRQEGEDVLVLLYTNGNKTGYLQLYFAKNKVFELEGLHWKPEE